MKQTAVEWLLNEIADNYKTPRQWQEIAEQAKAMEKEQIIDAYNKNLTGLDMLEQEEGGLNWAEQYYNETYGQGSNNYTFNNK